MGFFAVVLAVYVGEYVKCEHVYVCVVKRSLFFLFCFCFAQCGDTFI